MPFNLHGLELRSRELVIRGGGGFTQAITPGTTLADYTFLARDVPVMEDGRWVYPVAIGLRAIGTVDQPASGGAALNEDQLGLQISDVRVEAARYLGKPVEHSHVSGAELSLFDQRLALAGEFPRGARTQIPSTDGDTAYDYDVIVPLGALGCMRHPADFLKPHVLTQDMEFRARGWRSTEIDGQSTGAVLESVTIRADLIYVLRDEFTLGTLFEFVEDVAPDGRIAEVSKYGQSAGLRVGITTDLVGILAHVWMSDQLTLGGADGLDTITEFESEQLGMRHHLDPVRVALRNLHLSWPRTGPISGDGGVVHDGVRHWFRMSEDPERYDLAANVDGALYFPIVYPAYGKSLSTVAHWRAGQTLKHKFTFTSTPAGDHVLRSCLVRQWSRDFLTQVATDVFGSGWAGSYTWSQKLLDGKEGATWDGSRYTPGQVQERKTAFLPWRLVRRGGRRSR